MHIVSAGALRVAWRRTAGSAAKIAVGIARSVTGAPAGKLAMTSLHCKPLSLIISSPRKSANRRAVVSDVIFRPS